MNFVRIVVAGAAVSVIAFAALIGASPVYAQSRAPDEAASTTSASPPDSTALTAAAMSPAKKKTLGQKVKALVAKLTPDRIKRDIEFRKASALFPDFCKHWEQDLHDRETNNLSKLEIRSEGRLRDRDLYRLRQDRRLRIASIEGRLLDRQDYLRGIRVLHRRQVTGRGSALGAPRPSAIPTPRRSSAGTTASGSTKQRELRAGLRAPHPRQG